MEDTFRDGYAAGYRDGYQRCRVEMTDECDRRIREVEREHGLAGVGSVGVPVPGGAGVRVERQPLALGAHGGHGIAGKVRDAVRKVFGREVVR